MLSQFARSLQLMVVIWLFSLSSWLCSCFLYLSLFVLSEALYRSCFEVCNINNLFLLFGETFLCSCCLTRPCFCFSSKCLSSFTIISLPRHFRRLNPINTLPPKVTQLFSRIVCSSLYSICLNTEWLCIDPGEASKLSWNGFFKI